MAWGRRRRGYGQSRTRTSTVVYRIQSDEEAKIQATVPYNKWLKHTKSRGFNHVVKVKCQESTHSIRLNQRGPIELLNHKDMAGEVSMIQLGSDVPRCFAFLKAYRQLFHKDPYSQDAQKAGLPFEVTEEVDALHNGKKGKSAAAMCLALVQNRAEINAAIDYLKVPMKLRAYTRIKSILNKLITRWEPDYRDNYYNWARYSGDHQTQQFNRGVTLRGFDYSFQPKPEEKETEDE